MITCSRDALQDQKDRASLILKFNSRLKLVIGKGKVYRWSKCRVEVEFILRAKVQTCRKCVKEGTCTV